jgi:hypothetical protein
VVLTQDDHLDYLTAVKQDPGLIPTCVKVALQSNALLLLGFRLDDWAFRAMFRAFLQKGRRPVAEEVTNVAVQLDVDDQRILNPSRARDYLVRLVRPASFEIYWGSTEQFLRELQPELQKRQGEANL